MLRMKNRLFFNLLLLLGFITCTTETDVVPVQRKSEKVEINNDDFPKCNKKKPLLMDSIINRIPLSDYNFIRLSRDGDYVVAGSRSYFDVYDMKTEVKIGRYEEKNFNGSEYIVGRKYVFYFDRKDNETSEDGNSKSTTTLTFIYLKTLKATVVKEYKGFIGTGELSICGKYLLMPMQNSSETYDVFSVLSKSRVLEGVKIKNKYYKKGNIRFLMQRNHDLSLRKFSKTEYIIQENIAGDGLYAYRHSIRKIKGKWTELFELSEYYSGKIAEYFIGTGTVPKLVVNDRNAFIIDSSNDAIWPVQKEHYECTTRLQYKNPLVSLKDAISLRKSVKSKSSPDAKHLGTIGLPYAFEKKVINKIKFSKSNFEIIGEYTSRPYLLVKVKVEGLKVEKAVYFKPSKLEPINTASENREFKTVAEIEQIDKGKKPFRIIPFIKGREKWEIHWYYKRIRGKRIDTLRFLKKGSKKIRKSFRFMSRHITHTVLSPDNNYLAVVSFDMRAVSKIHLLDLNSLKKLPHTTDFRLSPSHCAESYLSPKGRYLAILSGHEGLLFFDLKKRKKLSVGGFLDHELHKVFFSSDNGLFIVATNTHKVEIFSLKNKRH
jgi:hypothetical protein